MSRRKDKHKNKDRKTRGERELSRELLNLFKKDKDKTYTAKEVLQNNQLWGSYSVNKIRSVLDKLAQRGEIQHLEKGRYKFLSDGTVVAGKIQMFRGGFGFLIVDDGDDIYVNAQGVGKALNGDLVKVKVIKPRRKKRSGSESKALGEVVEIVERARTEFVGTLTEEPNIGCFVKLDDTSVYTDFYIPEKHVNGAKDGEKVIIHLLNWDRKSPEAEVVRVLGEAGTHETEMHAILAHYGFQVEFPDVVEHAAAQIPVKIPDKEIAKRKDIRDVLTFTIDPDDAKDFDDALSFKELNDGTYEIGVHIADVSHYVKEGSLIDGEAFKRGTSVYLVDRTVPMLPEKLSNNLCSLRPNEDKLCYSILIKMDENAKVLDEWIGRTVIHSDRRFAYEEAQDMLDGKLAGPEKEALDIINGLAKKLQDRRFKNGSIGFETDEVKFVLDKDDKPIKVIRKVRLDAHKLIEDFMLLANRRVAYYISNLFKNPPLPFVYRIHDRPDPEKLSSLMEFAKVFGYEVDLMPAEEDALSRNLNGLMKSVEGKPEQNVIETVGIRTMAKAIYSTQNIGHFGLGFKHYTHFTSPIRRYPDLMVHRLLAKYGSKNYKVNQEMLEQQCNHSSVKERTAVQAERTSIKYKQVEFLQDKIGEEFNGIISGVAEMGLFVELEDNLCEGLIPIWGMKDDYYELDKAHYCLRGKQSEIVYRLGDPVRVRVSETNLIKRTIDLEMIKD